MSSVGKLKKVKLKKKYFWICPSSQIIHALLFGTEHLTGAVSCHCVSLREVNVAFCIILCDPDLITDFLCYPINRACLTQDKIT